MGFLDDLSSTLSRGANVTAKTANVIKLKAQIADLNNQRKNLCSSLGAALYDRTKDIGALTSGLEELYDGIRNCDERISGLQAEIDRIEEQETADASSTTWMRTCPNCGYSMNANDKFCSRCGKPLEANQGWSQQGGASGDPQQPGTAV